MPIALDPGTVDHVVGQVHRAADDLRRQRTEAALHVDGLLDGSWTGDAAHAFGQGWADWTAAADDVLDVLGRLADLIAAARRDLTADDDRAQVSMLRLAARLG